MGFHGDRSVYIDQSGNVYRGSYRKGKKDTMVPDGAQQPAEAELFVKANNTTFYGGFYSGKKHGPFKIKDSKGEVIADGFFKYGEFVTEKVYNESLDLGPGGQPKIKDSETLGRPPAPANEKSKTQL